MSEAQTIIKNLEDVRSFFAQQQVPTYFISATNFNLINLHDWVASWGNINFVDCYDGAHPKTTIPHYDIPPLFNSSEEINHYLLGHKDVVQRLEKDREGLPDDTPNSRVIFLFFDQALENICRSLNLDICLPPNALVKEVDNKIVTTEIGNLAGVPSVPNALAPVKSYDELCALAEKHGLSSHLVVQTAYGDSGKTTFFISNREDYDAVADQIECEDKVKVMKRIRCEGTAIEACATRCGTFVGPLLTELIGFEELTPYAGGWCGNELYASSFSPSLRATAHELTEKLGDELWKRGYRGYFEVDYLIDLDTDDIYLGELNPRVTGISAMTNTSHFCSQNLPLFLFHLLEYSQCQLELNPAEFNALSLQEGAEGTASQLILKHTQKDLKMLSDAPVSGVYRYDGRALHLLKPSVNRREALAADEAFIMRIMNKGEIVYKGADLGIMFANFPVKAAEKTLTEDAKGWLKALAELFQTRELNAEEQAMVERYSKPTELLKGHGGHPEST